jgi:hypothetical protein
VTAPSGSAVPVNGRLPARPEADSDPTDPDPDEEPDEDPDDPPRAPAVRLEDGDGRPDDGRPGDVDDDPDGDPDGDPAGEVDGDDDGEDADGDGLCCTGVPGVPGFPG